MSGSRRRAAAEFAAILACGLANLAVEEFAPGLKIPILAGMATAWGIYLFGRRSLVREWGFRTDTLMEVFQPLAALILGSLLLLSVFEPTPLPASSIWIFLLYPFWGLLQQFALQVLVARNLRTLKVPLPFVIAITAVLFGLAHWPEWDLVKLTALGGIFWTALYLWRPNLWLLSICHAWLGTLAYYWVLDQDPWSGLF